MGLSTTTFGYEYHEDGDEHFFYETKETDILSAFFNIKVKEQHLPSSFSYSFGGSDYTAENLRCKGGCNKGKNACWCSLHDSLRFKNQTHKTFRIKAVNRVKEYLLDIDIFKMPKKNETDPQRLKMNLKVRNVPHFMKSNTTTPTNTSDCRDLVSVPLPNGFTVFPKSDVPATNCVYGVQFIMTDYSVTDGKIVEKLISENQDKTMFSCKFVVDCETIPDNILIINNNIEYIIDPDVYCKSYMPYKKLKFCAKDKPCWCLLENQLKTKHTGKIRLPVLEKKTNKIKHWMKVIAKIEKKNDLEKIELTLDFWGSTWVTITQHTEIPKIFVDFY